MSTPKEYTSVLKESIAVRVSNSSGALHCAEWRQNQPNTRVIAEDATLAQRSIHVSSKLTRAVDARV